MRLELSRLTMSQYIGILTGETKCEPEERQRLVFEYARLASPAATTAYIGRRKGDGDDKATLLLFQICNNLMVMGQYGDVRAILAEYGLTVDGMSDRALALEVDRRMKRAKSMVERKESEREVEEDGQAKTPAEVRLLFDKQAASLMTYFKFQIDMDTIKASVFACMVDQADREVKAKQAAIRSMKT